jgi:uncharacterized membrane protein
MAITNFLLGVFLLGMVVLIAGIFCWIKTKYKVVGIIATALGLLFMLIPISIYLLITITTSVTGGM